MDQNTSNQSSGQTPSAADLSALINQLATQTNAPQTEPAGANPTPVQPTVAPESVPTAPTPTVEPVQTVSQTPTPVQEQVSQQPTPVAAQPAQTAPEPTAEPKPDYQIVIYTIPTCPYCQAEKDYLKEQNLQFSEKSVENNEPNLKEMLDLSDNFAGVPVTLLQNREGNKTIVRGFTKEEFREELGKLQIIKVEAVNNPAPTQNPVSQEAPQPPVTPPQVEPAAQPASAPNIPDLS